MFRTWLFGLISCAGTMDGWVRSSSTVHWYCVAILCSISKGPVVWCVSPLAFDSVQWWPHSSILDPGKDESPVPRPHTPGSCGPVVGFCGSLLGHQVSSTAIPGPAGLFTISFLAGDASYWRRCMAIWGYLCASSGTAPLSGFFK